MSKKGLAKRKEDFSYLERRRAFGNEHMDDKRKDLVKISLNQRSCDAKRERNERQIVPRSIMIRGGQK